jgi:hypothetical protein
MLGACLAQPGSHGYIKSTGKSPRSLDKPHPRHKRHPHQISIGRFSVKVPASRTLRIALGIGLIIGGLLGFLPILGFWMLPLGLLLLSIDFHFARRFRRRIEVWWGRRKRAKKKR